MKLILLEAEGEAKRIPPTASIKDADKVDKIIDDTVYFPNQPLVQSIRRELSQAIEAYGVNPDTNPFLKFAQDERNKDLKEIPSNLSKRLYEAFEQESIKFGGNLGAEHWIFDKNAYNGGEFKLNLLIVLSDIDQLRRFNLTREGINAINNSGLTIPTTITDKMEEGTLKNAVTAAIGKPLIKASLEYNQKETLTALVDAFQAAYSEDTDEDEEEVDSLEGTEEEQKKKLFDYFRARTVKEISDDELNKIIKDNYRAGMELTRLKGKINKAIDDILKLDIA